MAATVTGTQESSFDPAISSQARQNAFATIAVLSCIISAVIGCVYWIARIGFDNPAAPVVKAVGLSFFIATGPVALRRFLRIELRPYRWMTSYSFLWLATLAAAVLLGALQGATGANALWLLVAIGIAGLVVALIRFFQSRSILIAVASIAGSAIFATWAAGVVWGRIYKNPLFFENLAATGVVHHDSLFLVAFSNMLRTYGAASTGLNGIPYIPYHWGSQLIFAELANLLGSSMLDFYQLGVCVITIPLFFAAVVAIATEVSFGRAASNPARSPFNAWFWIIFLAATIGVIPIEAMDALGVWTSNLLISESYTIGVPVGLLLASTTAVFWRNRSSLTARLAGGLSTSDKIFLVLVLPLGIGALGFLKISLLVLGFAAAMFLALRVRAYATPTGVLAMVIATGVFAVTYRLVSLPAHYQGLRPLDFLRDYVPRAWWVFFPLLHLFWSWIYVGTRVVQERPRTFRDLRDQISAGRLLDVEAVIVVAAVGLAPGLLLHIDGGSAFYFSDVQRWLALGLLLSLASGIRQASSRLTRFPLVKIAAVIVALPLLATMMSNTVYWTKRFAQANAATRMTLYPATIAASLPAGIHGLPQLLNSDLLRRGLKSSRNYAVVDQLRRLETMDKDVRRRTALFIPQTETAYWQVLTRPGDCSFSSFVAPALSTMAMIDGMPPFGCALSPFYGLGQYQPRRELQSANAASPALLCSTATNSRLDKVMVLHFDEPGAMTSNTVDCR